MFMGEDHYLRIGWALNLMVLIDRETWDAGLGAESPRKSTIRKAARDLCDVRRDMMADADFHIECSDNEKIPVHSLIMKTYWPFFKSMMENDCAESSEKVLKLDYPSDWIEVLVSFVYGQSFQMTFEQAAGLLVLGEMYQLPALAEMAADEIMSSPKGSLKLEEALLGWRQAHEAQNIKVKTFLATEIASRQSQKGLSDEDKGLFAQLSAEEAVGLYFDTLSIGSFDK